MAAILLETSSIAMHSGSVQIASSDLHTLPPGYLPFEEFAQQFSLGGTSTEQLQEKTKTLSQTMQSDVVKGLEMLFDSDQAVLVGFEHFIPVIESLAPDLARRMKAGGRIFLVGSGSSGRVAVDIAAKCNLIASSGQEQIRGIIAGGDSALIRAKEGFEDSEPDGEQCLRSFNLKAEDTVLLISASGSASFNVGCGHFAANKGSQVLYFYNSKGIPSRTKQLFDRQNNPVRPLELDIGPQAISGSTRLQGASLAEMCLGALLGTTLFHCEGKALDASKYPQDLLVKMREGNHLIFKHLETIGQFVKKEAAVFLSPSANFQRLRDETFQGYVTVIGEKDSLREILIDATETSPTFSMSPIRRETEVLQKRGEFRAYLAGEKDNRAAWEALLGRTIEPEALVDTSQFLLALEAAGNNSYDKRPVGAGNFVIGVTKRVTALGPSNEVLDLLHNVVFKGGDAGLIALSRDKMPLSFGAPLLTLFLDEVPFDHLGLVETLLLKQILNLISNGSMVLTGKVHGNRMIDVRASNQKLIDRSLRLIKEIWGDFQRPMPLSDEELYHYIAHVCALKKSYTSSGIYAPSVVKIILGLIYLEKKPVPGQFQEVLAFLAERQERLDFLATENGPFTFDKLK
jgi:N-acetylmuramic acid 6-phosphate etherase